MKPVQIDPDDAERIAEVVLAIVTKDRDRMTRIAALEIPEEELFWPYLDRLDVTFIAPPADQLASADVHGDDEWIFVDVPMWSEEEGRSDYTLVLDIALSSAPHPIRLRSLHIH